MTIAIAVPSHMQNRKVNTDNNQGITVDNNYFKKLGDRRHKSKLSLKKGTGNRYVLKSLCDFDSFRKRESLLKEIFKKD